MAGSGRPVIRPSICNGFIVSSSDRVCLPRSASRPFRPAQSWRSGFSALRLLHPSRPTTAPSAGAPQGLVSGACDRLFPDGSRDSSQALAAGIDPNFRAVVATDGRTIASHDHPKDTVSFGSSPTARSFSFLTPVSARGSAKAAPRAGRFGQSRPKPTEKFPVPGFFTAFDGTPGNNVVRLNANGIFDSSFTRAILNTAAGSAPDLVTLPNVKALGFERSTANCLLRPKRRRPT